MKYRLFRPFVLIVLLIVLPSTIITIYQLNSINQQEEAFEDVYQRQLKSVLFSLNMYSDDVVHQWVSRVSIYIEEGNSKTDSVLNTFLKNYSQIQGIFIQEIQGGQNSKFGTLNSSLINSIQTTFKEDSIKINRLFGYLENNYRKVLVLNTKDEEGTSILTFALVKDEGKKYVGALVLDARNFIVDMLAPRIQSVVLEDIAIGLMDDKEQKLIYTNNKETEFSSTDINEQIWQLPHYSIFLKPLGDSAHALIKKRSSNNLLLLVIVDFILILGGVLIYKNIKKQLQLAKIKSDFVSNVSHEIRTPLSLISLYAESLSLNRVLREEKLKYSYQVIYRESLRLTKIVNNILNFSKMESGKRKFTFHSFDLNKTIRQIIVRYKDDVENNYVDFIINPQVNIPQVIGDKEAIDEVLINLIDNAIKYSNDNKKVELSTGLLDKQVWFEVRDNGIGIPIKEQSLIFNQFYRVTKGDLAHQAKGSGLGLNIVKQIVDAHRGKIFVDSELGKGSSFKVYLPVDD